MSPPSHRLHSKAQPRGSPTPTYHVHRTHQAAGTGVGGNTDAGRKGATGPGGQPLPKLLSQERHERGKEAEPDVRAGEQDLRGVLRAGRAQQLGLHGLLRDRE